MDKKKEMIIPALAAMRTNLGITIHIIGALVTWCLGLNRLDSIGKLFKYRVTD